MKTKILFLSVVAALIFFGCKNDGLTKDEVNNLLNGPNSIKGSITGKMLDGTPYSFAYDYHVTTNDVLSYSRGWIENMPKYSGDTVLFVSQFFFFDRNGYADHTQINDYHDDLTPSGQYVSLTMFINLKTMKLMPTDYSFPAFEGMWQNITSKGNRFAYSMTAQLGSATPGTFEVATLTYDKNTQLLTGSMKLDMPDNNTNTNYNNNHNATTITGDFKIYVPKELFQVTDPGTALGNVYRIGK